MPLCLSSLPALLHSTAEIKKTWKLCMPDSSASKFSVRNVHSKGKVKDWMVEGKKLFISFHWLVCWIQHAEGIEDGWRWLQVTAFQYHLWWLHHHYKQYFGCWVVFALLISNRIFPISVWKCFQAQQCGRTLYLVCYLVFVLQLISTYYLIQILLNTVGWLELGCLHSPGKN